MKRETVREEEREVVRKVTRENERSEAERARVALELDGVEGVRGRR